MKVGDLVRPARRNYGINDDLVGVLFMKSHNMMVLWSDGDCEPACNYYESELEVISESR